MMIAQLIGLICIVFASSVTTATTDPIVKIENGEIRGLDLKNIYNRTFYAFLEIPYAAPPVGSLRFRAPTPAGNWNGVLNTTQNTKTCWEVSLPHKRKMVNKPDEDEDCLYLNVFTPKLSDKEGQLPVLAYFYGGNFASGHAWFENFDPQLLVDNGIVAVTINFRGGPLGFLTTEDGIVPGNLGLKDQRLALQWIQKNIPYFGGDPSKVTVMGHSSGAMSIGFHMLSKKSKGLFRSAILQSGTVLTPSTVRKHANYYAYQLGKQLSPNFTGRNTSTDLLNLLRNTSASDINNATVPFYPGTTFLGRQLMGLWSPVIEDPNEEDAVITGPMYEDLFNGNFLRVPTLMGVASEEFVFYVKALKIANWAPHVETPETLVPEDSDVIEDKKLEHGRQLKNIYTNTTFQEHLGSLYRFLSDAQFRVPAVCAAELQSKFSDVYFYQFSYYGEKSAYEGFEHPEHIPGLGRAGHIEDRNYLFLKGPKRWDQKSQFPPSDLLMQDRMVRLWTNFIKYMNPTPEKDPLLQNVVWPTVRNEKYNFTYLDIDVNLTLVYDYPREYAKWKPLIEKDYQHPITYL